MTPTTPVYEECQHTVTSQVNMDEGGNAGGLRQVFDARDTATWNFDFQLSTPLEGRYCWRRVSVPGHAVTGAAAVGRKHRRHDWFSVGRGGALGHSLARRRLLFDEHDARTAHTALSTFLVRRLVSASNRHRPVVTRQASLPHRSQLRSTCTSVADAAAAALCHSDQHQNTAVSLYVHHQTSSSSSSLAAAAAARRTAATSGTTSCDTRTSPVLRTYKITGKINQ